VIQSDSLVRFENASIAWRSLLASGHDTESYGITWNHSNPVLGIGIRQMCLELGGPDTNGIRGSQ
jgi:hypothetical protein